jgi:hypothetical protein
MTIVAGIGFMAGPPVTIPNKDQSLAVNLTHRR